MSDKAEVAPEPKSDESSNLELLTDYSLLADNESKLNIKAVLCKRCGSIIIKENVATLLFEPERKITLPSMVKGGNAVQEDVDTFWLLKSPMEFENVGFTNNVNNIKYLCCADCEVGPVGLAMSTKNNEFLVAANRVDYK